MATIIMMIVKMNLLTGWINFCMKQGVGIIAVGFIDKNYATQFY